MKTITDDPEGFFETGGWTFLDPKCDDENNPEEVEEEEEDDTYVPPDIYSEESGDDLDCSEYSEDIEREREALASSVESGKD
jgi:nucleosome binding factor SPN SPT16 subunit